MSHWLQIKNAQTVSKTDIPTFHLSELTETMVQLINKGHRVVQFCGSPRVQDNSVIVTAVLADDSSSRLLICKASTKASYAYDSMTPQVPSVTLFERELWEQTGIVPRGHPNLKPLRSSTLTLTPPIKGEEVWRQSPVKGEGVFIPPPAAGEASSYMESAYEVNTVPQQEGITEPGIFRFLCQGQEVYHADIEFGYQHRGVEALFKEGRAMSKAHLAESIIGDSVIAHVWAYAMAMESLSSTYVSMRAEIIRGIALELQRIAMHLSSLAFMSSTIGFLPGVSSFCQLRSEVLDLMLMLCGNRLGRGLIRPGGVIFDISDAIREHILNSMDGLHRDTEAINAYFLSSPGVLSRLQGTAVINTELAWNAGIVGVCAKASGLPIDCRADQPFGIYRKDKVRAELLTYGDAFARAKIRALEIDDSIALIRKWLSYGFMVGDIMAKPSLPASDSIVVSMVEGWRGEVSHMVTTGSNSEVEHYKVVDASFHNYVGPALAIRGGCISDFPLCNKSFDLSSCGVDL
ncbi:MAG: NADH-quinone oxidoreductase subunit C [Nitrospirae bacterium]|nr:NADH-quinone oxidoreductase subunit C [Nitrospirota bacterium]